MPDSIAPISVFVKQSGACFGREEPAPTLLVAKNDDYGGLSSMKAIRDNGLTIALVAVFLFSLAGMLFSGHSAYNQELSEHGQPRIELADYATSGQFLSALWENWESEFLQMAAYVILTAMLFQRGSAESRDPDEPDRPGDELPAQWNRLAAWLYAYSLGLVLAFLFIASFALHGWASLHAVNEEALRHGAEMQTLVQYLTDSRLWFESFQNWQSEFLSTAALVVFSIFLRHRGSPESKPVNAAHADTGT